MINYHQATHWSDFHSENPRRPGTCIIWHKNGYWREIRGQIRVPVKNSYGYYQVITDQIFEKFFIPSECPFCDGGNKKIGTNFSTNLATNPYRSLNYHKTYRRVGGEG